MKEKINALLSSRELQYMALNRIAGACARWRECIEYEGQKLCALPSSTNILHIGVGAKKS